MMAASNAVSQVNSSIQRCTASWVFDKLREHSNITLRPLRVQQLQQLFDEAAGRTSFDTQCFGEFAAIGRRFKYFQPETALMLIQWSITKMHAKDLENFLEHMKLSFFSKVLHQDRLADPKKLKKQLDKVEKQVSYLFLTAPQTRVEKRSKVNDLKACRKELWQIKNEIGNLQATISFQETLYPPIKISPVQIKKRIGSTAIIILKWAFENKHCFDKKTLTAINTFDVSEKKLHEEATDEHMSAWKESYKPTLMQIEDEKDGLLKKVQSEITRLSVELDGPPSAIVEELDDADRAIETVECLSLLFFTAANAQAKLKLSTSDWQEMSKEVIARGITLEILRSCKTEAELLQAIKTT